MQFVGVADEWPGVSVRVFDCCGVKRCEVSLVFRQCPPERHCPRPPLADLRIFIQEGVRHRVENLVTEDGRLRGVPSENFDFTRRDRLQHLPESVDVHRFVQGVPHRFEHQRMIRHFHIARHGVVLAHDLFWEYRREQVVRTHPQEGRRRFLAVGEAQ